MKHITQVLVLALLLVAGGAVADFDIDVNSADAETLAAVLTGVGPARAEAIVEYRERNGRFESIEQLLEVPGIGPAVLDANRENIRVDDE